LCSGVRFRDERHKRTTPTRPLTTGYASAVRAVWFADLMPDRVQPGAGRFVFVPGSATDEVDGRVLVEAAGPPGVLRTVYFARSRETNNSMSPGPLWMHGG
jgi:hypothetical protein